jgi:Protein of unknown function (DUF2628)
MAVYTVHEPPLPRNASSPPPERFVFVRDGFSLAAALFGPFWMLRHRMWLVLFGYIVVLMLLGAALQVAQGTDTASLSVGILLALLIGFEAGTLRRFTLARRRFRNVGVVVADDVELAERRFFDSWVKAASGSESKPGSPTAFAPAGVPRGALDVVGLFPEPGAPR